MSAKILKSFEHSAGAPPSTAPKIIDREVMLANDEARRILAGAEARARELAASAEQQAEKIRQDAEERGRSEGLARWQERLVEVGEARRRLLRDAEPEIVKLAVRLAEKVLRKRLDDDPGALETVLQESLRTLRGGRTESVVIRAHPGQAEALVACRQRLLARDPRWQALEVVADEMLEPLDCRIESECGTVDLGVGTQLRALERLLLQGGGS